MCLYSLLKERVDTQRQDINKNMKPTFFRNVSKVKDSILWKLGFIIIIYVFITYLFIGSWMMDNLQRNRKCIYYIMSMRLCKTNWLLQNSPDDRQTWIIYCQFSCLPSIKVDIRLFTGLNNLQYSNSGHISMWIDLLACSFN